MRLARAVLLLALSLTITTLPLQAQQDHPWLIRARGIVIAPDASSEPAGLDVKADAVAEIDITRTLNRYLSLELVLATASQEVKSGSTSLGSVNHLPPTLLLQLHPVEHGAVQPYVGAGGNLTVFYNKSGALENFDLDTSVNWAVQAGADFPISERALFNIDGKYVRITTDVKSGGTTAFDLKINPFVIGAGFGYRF